MGGNSSKTFTMRFPGVTGISLLLFGLLVTYFYFHLGSFSLQDVVDYQELMKGHSHHQDEVYISKQRRLGLRKDIIFYEKDKPLHVSIISAAADLILERHPSGVDIVEQLSQVKCFVQEEKFYLLADGKEALEQLDGRLLLRGANTEDLASYFQKSDVRAQPVQLVLQMEAAQASYFYRTEQFVAENVKMTRLVFPGHSLNFPMKALKILTSGTADRVEFSLAGQGLNFKADRFKAKLYSRGTTE